MKRSKCLNCGNIFKSKTDKKKHKKEYPNGSCKDLKGGEKMETEKKIERKSPIQKVEKIIVPKEQAKIEWKKYCEVLKKRKDKHLKIMKESMYFAKQGKALINIYDVIKKGGLNKNNEPRLAIARADINEVLFERRDTGSGIFGVSQRYSRGVEWLKDNVYMPDKTFKIHWEREENSTWNIKGKLLKTKVPLVPVELTPEGSLRNYYILWEVKSWEILPEVKDPFLLKRISENMFVILGSWDITELERAIIEGLK